jgi:hypothetical protein
MSSSPAVWMRGWLDAISWAGLLVPLLVIAWALRFRRP